MEQLRGAGHATGEYMGGGRGEDEREEPDDNDKASDECDLVDECQVLGQEELEEDSNDNANPLLFFFDVETTGLSIYQDHIVELAAKVIGVPLVSQPTFSSLVHTPRNIPTKGLRIHHHIPVSITQYHNFFSYSDSEDRNISHHATSSATTVNCFSKVLTMG